MNARIINDHSDLLDVINLLKSSKLPYQDIQLKDNIMIAYHDDNGDLIGSGGLEFYNSFALLRSVAVDESQRGKSFGKYIVKDLLDRAKSKSVKAVFLLTETAHDFFHSTRICRYYERERSGRIERIVGIQIRLSGFCVLYDLPILGMKDSFYAAITVAAVRSPEGYFRPVK